MALARKRSSLITIDDVIYRWVVSPDSGYMTLVVEFADDPGQRLEKHFSYNDDSECLAQTQITPKVVRESILAALANGWTPMQKGIKPFRVH